MGWEIRHGANLYYYRKARAGGVVRSVFVGKGEAARLEYFWQLWKRREAEQVREAQRRERERGEASERAANEVSAMARLLTDAAFLAAGYHLHKRQWRRAKNDGC